jgi:hypothetical protein
MSEPGPNAVLHFALEPVSDPKFELKVCGIGGGAEGEGKDTTEGWNAAGADRPAGNFSEVGGEAAIESGGEEGAANAAEA